MVENWTEALETTVEVLKTQSASQESSLQDVMWKLEEAENRQRRNNLRLLGIPENSEGSNIIKFTINLLRNSLPELAQWDWDKEIQWVHRFPLAIPRRPPNDQSYPRAILIYFGNFLLRQAVYDLARPNKKRNWENFSFFMRPDFAHATVERRWRLGQLITPFQKNRSSSVFTEPC